MKIGVDAGCLASRQGGVYQMTVNLLTSLRKVDRQNQYQLYSWQPIKDFFGKRMINIVAMPRRGWLYLGLPKQLRHHQPDVFLAPAQALPSQLPCPTLVVVHDLGFERCPELYPDGRRLRQLTQSALKGADHFLAVSQATAQDLAKFYDVPEAKISVAWEGCDKKVYHSKSGHKKPYFLFAGAAKPSKNIAGLLRGFAYFCQKKAGYELWLVGDDFQPYIKSEKKVKNLGFVSQKKLVSLYQRATALVTPAFWEGFGLPLVEAMACGCPIIAGNTGSQPEVVGKVGLMVDPADQQQIGQAMLKLAGRPDQRQKMALLGLKRAKLFSWDRFAKKVLKALNEIKR